MLLLFAVMHSCNKLDEYNPSGSTADAVWNTAQGFPANYFMPTEFVLDLFDETKDLRYSATFQDTWKCNALIAKAK